MGKPRARVRLPKPEKDTEENEGSVKVICDKLSGVGEPSIETEGGGKENVV